MGEVKALMDPEDIIVDLEERIKLADGVDYRIGGSFSETSWHLRRAQEHIVSACYWTKNPPREPS